LSPFAISSFFLLSPCSASPFFFFFSVFLDVGNHAALCSAHLHYFLRSSPGLLVFARLRFFPTFPLSSRPQVGAAASSSAALQLVEFPLRNALKVRSVFDVVFHFSPPWISGFGIVVSLHSHPAPGPCRRTQDQWWVFDFLSISSPGQ